MAVQLPAPGPLARRLTHDGQPVEVLAVLLEVVHELGQVAVQTHHRGRLLEAAHAQAGAQQAVRGGALRIGELMEAHALARRAVDVVPLAPLDVVGLELRLLPLLGCERGEERVGRGAHRCGGDAGRPDREQAAHGRAICRHAHERLELTLLLAARGQRAHPDQPHEPDQDQGDAALPAHAHLSRLHESSFRLGCVRGTEPYTGLVGCNSPLSRISVRATGRIRYRLPAHRPHRKATAAAVTPTIPAPQPRTGNSAAIATTSMVVAAVMLPVVRPMTSTALWNDSSTDSAGSGTSTIVGTRANAASRGARPDTVSNQKLASGVNATSASAPDDASPSHRPKRATSRVCSPLRPSSAIAAS